MRYRVKVYEVRVAVYEIDAVDEDAALYVAIGDTPPTPVTVEYDDQAVLEVETVDE